MDVDNGPWVKKQKRDSMKLNFAHLLDDVMFLHPANVSESKLLDVTLSWKQACIASQFRFGDDVDQIFNVFYPSSTKILLDKVLSSFIILSMENIHIILNALCKRMVCPPNQLPRIGFFSPKDSPFHSFISLFSKQTTEMIKVQTEFVNFLVKFAQTSSKQNLQTDSILNFLMQCLRHSSDEFRKTFFEKLISNVHFSSEIDWIVRGLLDREQRYVLNDTIQHPDIDEHHSTHSHEHSLLPLSASIFQRIWTLSFDQFSSTSINNSQISKQTNGKETNKSISSSFFSDSGVSLLFDLLNWLEQNLPSYKGIVFGSIFANLSNNEINVSFFFQALKLLCEYSTNHSLDSRKWFLCFVETLMSCFSSSNHSIRSVSLEFISFLCTRIQNGIAYLFLTNNSKQVPLFWEMLCENSQSIISICKLVQENWKNSGIDSQTQWHFIQRLVFVVISRESRFQNKHLDHSNQQIMNLSNQLFKQYLTSRNNSIIDSSSTRSSNLLLDWFFSFDSKHTELLSTMFSDLLSQNFIVSRDEQFILAFISQFNAQATWSTFSTFDSIKSTFSAQFFQANSGVSDCSFSFLSFISHTFRQTNAQQQHQLKNELISIFVKHENGTLLLKLISLIQTNNTDLQKKVLGLLIDIFETLKTQQQQIQMEVLKQLELYVEYLCGLLMDSNPEIKNAANSCLAKLSQLDEKMALRIASVLIEKLLRCTNEEKSKSNGLIETLRLHCSSSEMMLKLVLALLRESIGRTNHSSVHSLIDNNINSNNINSNGFESQKDSIKSKTTNLRLQPNKLILNALLTILPIYISKKITIPESLWISCLRDFELHSSDVQLLQIRILLLELENESKQLNSSQIRILISGMNSTNDSISEISFSACSSLLKTKRIERSHLQQQISFDLKCDSEGFISNQQTQIRFQSLLNL